MWAYASTSTDRSVDAPSSSTRTSPSTRIRAGARGNLKPLGDRRDDERLGSALRRGIGHVGLAHGRSVVLGGPRRMHAPVRDNRSPRCTVHRRRHEQSQRQVRASAGRRAVVWTHPRHRRSGALKRIRRKEISPSAVSGMTKCPASFAAGQRAPPVDGTRSSRSSSALARTKRWSTCSSWNRKTGRGLRTRGGPAH